MEYIRVDWHHEFEDEPAVFYSEIGEGRWETRAVREYRDGHLEWADQPHEIGCAILAELPIPELEEISAQPEFDAFVIEASDFERLWSAARAAG
jgi:hypothetical protein